MLVPSRLLLGVLFALLLLTSAHASIIDMSGVWVGEPLNSNQSFSLELGAVGRWSATVELQEGGIRTFLAKIEPNTSKCTDQGDGIISWSGLWTRREYVLVAPTSPPTTTEIGAGALVQQITSSPHCTIGEVRGEQIMYDGSTRNLTCPVGTAGQKFLDLVPQNEM